MALEHYLRSVAGQSVSGSIIANQIAVLVEIKFEFPSRSGYLEGALALNFKKAFTIQE